MDKALLDKFVNLFFPYTAERMQEATKNLGRFVHYTSAEVALSIIQNESIWMRRAITMNDSGEIAYGLARLKEALESPVGKTFWEAVNSIWPQTQEEVSIEHLKLEEVYRQDTYLTCISEHDISEDQMGRLSMWRAYGGRNGVGIVLNGNVFQGEYFDLGAVTAPVMYATHGKVERMLHQLTQNVLTNRPLIESFGYTVFNEMLKRVLRYSALCIKHPGFAEEKEWRIIFSPILDPTKVITRHTKVVNGAPQRIAIIPLNGDSVKGVPELTIPKIVERLIIGPTEHPLAIEDAFRHALGHYDNRNLGIHVIVSNIPLRTSS